MVKLNARELRVVQQVLLDMYGLPKSVIDQKFADLPISARRARARSRQRSNGSTPHGRRVCSKCGTTENLQRHHLIPTMFGGRNVKDNLKWLCKGCHDEVHGR